MKRNSYRSKYETTLFRTYAKEIVEHFSTESATPNIYTYSGFEDEFSDNKRKLANGYASFRVVSGTDCKNYFLLGNTFTSTYTNIDGDITSYSVITLLKSWLTQMSKSRNKSYIPNIILCSHIDGMRAVTEIDSVALLRDFKDGKLRTTFNVPSTSRKAVIVDTPFEDYVVKVTKETNEPLTSKQLSIYISMRKSSISEFVINNKVLSNFFAYVYDKSTGLLSKRIEIEDVQQFVVSFTSSKGTVSKRLKDGKVFRCVNAASGNTVYVRLSREARSDFEERADIKPEATPEIVKKLRDTGKTYSEIAKILHKRKADVISLYKKYFEDLEVAQTNILLQMTSEEERTNVIDASMTRITMKNKEIDADANDEDQYSKDVIARIRAQNLANFKRQQ